MGKAMEQLAFLIVSSTPSLKNNIAQISSHSFQQSPFIFSIFCFPASKAMIFALQVVPMHGVNNEHQQL